MAVRLTKGGFQSFDPLREIKKKLRPRTSAGAPPPKTTTELPGEKPGGTFIDPKTGEVSGIELPGGRTFLGLSPADVEKVLAQQEQKGVITPTTPVGGVGRRPGELEEAAELLAEAGAFEEVTPTVSDLRPETGEGLLAPSAEALVAAAQPRSLLGLAKDKGWIKGLPSGEEEFPLDEETLREASLRQIRINSFDKGISQRESFGTFVEAIPFVGNRARAWAGGLIESPSKNADNVIANLNVLKEDASTGQEKVRNGLESPEFGLEQARWMEEEVARLEGRLKLLIQVSPILRANTDEINRMQSQVLATKKKISRYRQAAEFGFTADLTGTGAPIPTDQQMFFDLKEFNEGT